MPCTHRAPKRASDPLEIELWMAVSHRLGAGPLQQQQCSRLLSLLSSPAFVSLIHVWKKKTFFLETASLCTHGCVKTYSVEQAGFEEGDLTASASLELGL